MAVLVGWLQFDSQVLCVCVIDCTVFMATLSRHLFAYDTTDWYSTVSHHSSLLSRV